MSNSSTKGTADVGWYFFGGLVALGVLGFALSRGGSTPIAPTGDVKRAEELVRVCETRQVQLSQAQRHLEDNERRVRAELRRYASDRMATYLGHMKGAIDKTRQRGFSSKTQRGQDEQNDFLDWLGGYVNGQLIGLRALADKFNQASAYLTDNRQRQSSFLKDYIQREFEAQVVRPNVWGKKYRGMITNRVEHAIPEALARSEVHVLENVKRILEEVSAETGDADPPWIARMGNKHFGEFLGEQASDLTTKPARAALHTAVTGAVIKGALNRLAQKGPLGKVSASVFKFSKGAFAQKVGLQNLAVRVSTKAASLTGLSGKLWHALARNAVKLATPAGFVIGVALDYSTSKVMNHYGRADQRAECDAVVLEISDTLNEGYAAAIDQAVEEAFKDIKENLVIEIKVPRRVPKEDAARFERCGD